MRKEKKENGFVHILFIPFAIIMAVYF